MRPVIVIVLLVLAFPLSTGHQDGGNLINAVLGNTPGISPTADDITRIRAHLYAVAERLQKTDTRDLSLELQRARARNIERIVQYAQAGRFPSKPESIPGRIPNFLDDSGARCAVGYLVEQDLGLDAVKDIAREHQFDYVPSIDSPVLAAWQTTSGLSPLELAMIQPTYDFRKKVDPDALEARIDTKMRELEKEGFAGQVVVALGRTKVVDACYGFLAGSNGRTPVTSDVAFDIASVTKTFTAAAIFSLIDDGRLDLDTRLKDVFPDAPPDKRKITIEQLLAHTSGLGSTYTSDGETDRDKAVKELLAQSLHSAPGEKFVYSDDGYVILAAVIEVVSHTAYEQYLGEKIMQMEKMPNTSFWGTPRGRLADFSRPLADNLLRPQWGQRGSGGILSTADDLYWWMTNFIGGRIIPGELVQEMTQVRRNIGDGAGMGYGWFQTIRGLHVDVLWTRGNEDFGHNAVAAFYPIMGETLVVTSNRFIGELPWSRRVQSELEPILLER